MMAVCKQCLQNTNYCACAPRRWCKSCHCHMDLCGHGVDPLTNWGVTAPGQEQDLLDGEPVESFQTGIFTNTLKPFLNALLKPIMLPNSGPLVPTSAPLVQDNNRVRWNRLMAAVQAADKADPILDFEKGTYSKLALGEALRLGWQDIDRCLQYAAAQRPTVAPAPVVPYVAPEGDDFEKRIALLDLNDKPKEKPEPEQEPNRFSWLDLK